MNTKVQYQHLLENHHWLSKRAVILKRDGHQCVNCGSDVTLQIHHRQYHISKATGEHLPPWEYKDVYLVTLCRKCHKAGHEKYEIPQYYV